VIKRTACSGKMLSMFTLLKLDVYVPYKLCSKQIEAILGLLRSSISLRASSSSAQLY
jgi:hypothetical protein